MGVEELIEFLVGGSLEKQIEEATEADIQERGFKIKLGKGGLSFNHKGKRAEEIVEDDVQDRGIHISGSASHSSSGGTHGQINSHYNHKFGGRDLEEIEDDVQERGWKIKLGKGGLSFNHKGKRAEEIMENDVQDRGFHVSGGVSHGSHSGTYGEINLGYDWGKKRDIGEVTENDVQERGWKIKLGKGGLSFNHKGKREEETVEDD